MVLESHLNPTAYVPWVRRCINIIIIIINNST